MRKRKKERPLMKPSCQCTVPYSSTSKTSTVTLAVLLVEPPSTKLPRSSDRVPKKPPCRNWVLGLNADIFAPPGLRQPSRLWAGYHDGAPQPGDDWHAAAYMVICLCGSGTIHSLPLRGIPSAWPYREAPVWVLGRELPCLAWVM